jgi:hypothetical protein
VCGTPNKPKSWFAVKLRFRAGLAAGCLILLAHLLGIGCIHSHTEAYNVRFSPDGKTVAFAYTECVGTYVPGAWPTGLVSQKVKVCAADGVPRAKAFRICGGISSAYRYEFYVEELAFSPDSKRLAIWSTGRVSILDVQSGRITTLTRGHEAIKSIAWTSDDELAYSLVKRSTGWGTEPLEFRVYRQKIDASPDRRIQVYREEGPAVPLSAVPSPDGRYVVTKPSPWGQCRMVDVMTGKAIDVGPKVGCVEGVAWRNDSSAVACSIRVHAVGPGGQWARPLGMAIHVLEVPPGSTSQLDAGGPMDGCGYDLAPRWTADNRYVVIDAGWIQCSLLDVRTQEVVALKDAIVRKMQLNDETAAPTLAPLPVPGWLWTRGADRRSYAIDYGGARITLLAEEWGWAMCPTGHRVAQVGDDGDVTIRSVELPSSP